MARLKAMSRGALVVTGRASETHPVFLKATPAFRVLLFVMLCGGAVLVLPPWIPVMPSSGVDSSWAAVLSHAFTHQWQFGKDLVFTFGPFGFVYAKLFDPGTYAWMLSAWVCIALTLGAGMALLLRNAKPSEALFLVALLFVGLRASVGEGPMFFADPVFFLLPLLLGLLVEDTARVARIAALALCVLLAFASLVKFTFWMLGIATIVVIESGRVLRGNRWPVHLVLYAASTLLFFLLAKQHLGGFSDYVLSSLAVASGYSEAMQIFARHPVGKLEVAAFVALAGAFVLIAAAATWRQAQARGEPWTEWLPLSVLLVFLFMAFKAGFVRHDEHALIAWGALTAGLAMCGARVLPQLPTSRARLPLVAICGLVALIAAVRNVRTAEEPISAFFSWPYGGSLGARVEAIGSLLAGTHLQKLVGEREAALEQIRRSNPLPHMRGSVDVYPWNAAVVLAHGLEYRPRPVFQSFAVFNPRLLQANADHLNSDRAASTLVLGLGTIDGRFLAQDEGALWPMLASLYDVEDVSEGYALLRRRASPRRLVWESGPQARTGWSQEIRIPQGDGPVWVQIDVQKTLMGRVVDLLFKAPVIDLVLTLEGGEQRTGRLTPTIAGQRFPISPLITTPHEWTEAFGAAGRGTRGLSVTSFRIEAPAPRALAAVYSDEIRVTFSRLSLAAQR